MPTYSSKCMSCGEEHTYIRKVAERDLTPECCGVASEKQLAMPQISAMAFTGHKGFHMPDGANGGKGTWIESGSDHKKFIERTGWLPADDGALEAKRKKAYAIEADDKKRHAAAVKAVTGE